MRSSSRVDRTRAARSPTSRGVGDEDPLGARSHDDDRGKSIGTNREKHEAGGLGEVRSKGGCQIEGSDADEELPPGDLLEFAAAARLGLSIRIITLVWHFADESESETRDSQRTLR